MTQTQRITNEVCDRHLPPSLENYLYALEDEKGNELSVYIDSDGNYRVGRDYRYEPEPEPVTGKFYLGMFWAFAIEGAIALAVWIGIHAWRWFQ